MKKLRPFFAWSVALALTACSTLQNVPAPAESAAPQTAAAPTATMPPSPTPTPPPIVRVERGDHALFNGEYENALQYYQTAFKDSPDPAVQAAAQWGAARVHFAEERYPEALNALQEIASQYPSSPYLPNAYFLQGFAYYRMKNYRAAADAWQTYLVLRPNLIDAYVQEWRGDALYEDGDYAAALSAYSAAIQADSIGDDIALDLKAAEAQQSLGDYEGALAVYDGVIARAASDYVKAQAYYESGLAYQSLGKTEEALGRFRYNIDNYPLSYHSYLSLVALLDAGGEASEIQRGLVDYFAGQYDVSIAAFDRYLAANADDGTAHYYRALALQDRGDYNAAVQAFDEFLNNYPQHPRWTDAWGEKAFIEWYQLGAYDLAAQTLLNYVSIAPASVTAADYLMSAARNYERARKEDQALQIWARVANEYPGSEQAAAAVFLMGVISYRNGNYSAAQDSFQRSLAAALTKNDSARALLWIGKTQQALGDSTSAQATWRDAQTRDPGGYYSERARDLLLERAPFAPPQTTNLTIDLAAEKKDADSWMRLTFNLPAETDLNGMGAWSADPRILRGDELWSLGRYEDARAEFESLRKELEAAANAEGSYRLANHLLELGLYRPAILAARQALSIAGLEEHAESMMAPVYFSHVRYGLYYPDIVPSNAQANHFDPLFLYSVIRQESLFEGFAVSNASARGLMQIIPSTGADMAGYLNWPPNYDESDLSRPDVSVAFGAHYLARNRDLLNGDLYAALAAYNGGPGNALEWQKLANADPDVFLETVRFEETRNYIRNIYEIYVVYRRLYGAAE
ncbi:MAG: transglycosylase SLT domain-containing protein [Anaerolineales bacterium]